MTEYWYTYTFSQMKTKSLYEKLVDHFGSQEETAERLGVKQPTVSGWVTNKHGMGPITALKAQRETDGAFRAEELCPDLAA